MEIAYTPSNSSWLNRIEAQFTALRYFALDGTDHASHEEQGSMIRRYIIWRNNHAYDERLRRVVDRANQRKRNSVKRWRAVVAPICGVGCDLGVLATARGDARWLGLGADLGTWLRAC